MDKKNYYRLSGLGLSLILLLAGCASAPEVPKPAPVEDVVEAPQAVQIKPDYPQRYTVVVGDTLWDISSYFLKDPWRWPEVWQNNPQVANPHLIYPGDVLILHYIDGAPYIMVERPRAPVRETQVEEDSYPTVRLYPKLREKELESAISTIPTDAISSFLIKPHVISKKELDDAPYVVSSVDGHLIAGVDNTLYIRNLKDLPNLRYTIVRKGDAYINPQNDKDILGYEAIYVAEGEITRKGDPASLIVKYAKREILNGDRLVVTEAQQPDRTYIPHAPQQSVNSQIISVVDGVSMVGKHQVVVLNLGRQDEVEPGHVLAVYRSGRIARDTFAEKTEEVELPGERSGLVMIFRVFDRVSYALVMDSMVPLRLYDRVTNP